MSTTTQTQQPAQKSTAQLCRDSIRAAGIDLKQLSVRGDRGSVRIEIKSREIGADAVEAAASVHERVRRCERTHDILEGGNTFVFVQHGGAVSAALCAEIAAAISADFAARGWASVILPCVSDSLAGFTPRSYQISKRKDGRFGAYRFESTETAGACLDKSMCWDLDQAVAVVAADALRKGVRS